jgi:hypothetical protein
MTDTTKTVRNADGDDVTRYAAKLKRLLEVATRQAGTPEGDLAQVKAFEFMEKYNLDASTLADDTQVEERKISRTIDVSGIYAYQLQRLACDIAYAVAGAHPLVAGKGNRRFVVVYGFESAVVTVQVLYTSLSLQVLGDLKSQRAWKNALAKTWYLKDYTSMQRFVWRRDYVLGFAYEVGRRLAEARRTTVEAAGSGAELVIIDRDKQAEDWALGFSGGNAKVSKLTSRDYSALGSGIEAGRAAAIGDGSSTLGGPKRRALT